MITLALLLLLIDGLAQATPPALAVCIGSEAAGGIHEQGTQCD